MKEEKISGAADLNFTGIPSTYYLIGLLSAFENRFQSMADKQMQQISWKQFFAIVCINLCEHAPTLQELSEIMGSSHQNVKQILLKLLQKGFVTFEADQNDRRKQRIILTDYCREFCKKNDQESAKIMDRIFEGISESDIETTIRTITRMTEKL